MPSVTPRPLLQPSFSSWLLFQPPRHYDTTPEGIGQVRRRGISPKKPFQRLCVLASTRFGNRIEVIGHPPGAVAVFGEGRFSKYGLLSCVVPWCRGGGKKLSAVSGQPSAGILNLSCSLYLCASVVICSSPRFGVRSSTLPFSVLGDRGVLAVCFSSVRRSSLRSQLRRRLDPDPRSRPGYRRLPSQQRCPRRSGRRVLQEAIHRATILTVGCCLVLVVLRSEMPRRLPDRRIVAGRDWLMTVNSHRKAVGAYKARTPLGRSLMRIRAKIKASGIALLDREALEKEVAERRGERE